MKYLRKACSSLLELINPIEKNISATVLNYSRGHIRVPDFINIGVQKSGTTWLSDNLRLHPDIYLPSQKEVHYFNAKFHYPLAYYLQYFSGRPESIVGEITPRYGIIGDDRIKFIKRIMPNVKLIAMLRHPVDRVWSLTKMHFLSHKPDRDICSYTEKEILSFWEKNNAELWCDYSALLHRWLDIFSEDNIHVIIFDDIVNKPEMVLENTIKFLGADLGATNYTKCRRVIYKGHEKSMPDLLRKRLFEYYYADIIKLNKSLNGSVSQWL